MRSGSLVILVACLASCGFAASLRSQIVDNLRGGCTSTDDFDYLYLMQQWPVTQGRHFGTNTTLEIFSLHGLWPNDNNGDYPCECTKEQFDPNKVSSLLSEMHSIWPSFRGNDESFWSHEWSKHGTCAAKEISELGSQYDFFRRTMDLHYKVGIIDAFAKAGIVPSDNAQYSLSSLHGALKNKLGVDGIIDCDGSGLIDSIGVCFDKNLQLMTCSSALHDSCNHDQVILPKTI